MQQLQESMRLAAEAAAASELGVILVDSDGIVVWANEALSMILPMEPDDIVGRPLDEVRLTALDRQLSHTQAEFVDPFGGVVLSESVTIPLEEGALLIELRPQRSANRDLDRLRSGLISTETMLRESQQLYREVFENSTDLIQSTDLDGRLLFANDAWLRRLGYTSAELGGVRLDRIIAPEYLDALEVFRCEAGAGPHRVRAEFFASDGSRVWVDGNVAQRLVGAVPVGTHAILRDVTESERVRQLKDEFVSMVNHEMRTPLTSITGSIGLLLDGVAGELPPKAMEFLDIASRNVERLTNIVSDVLDAERLALDRLRVVKRDLSVRDVLRQVAEEHRGHATREAARLEVDAVPATCDSDEQRLNQIIGNFVANAIRHSPSGGRILLAGRLGGDTLRFAVVDQGEGVPVDFRPHILERFSQAPGTHGGSGLGLGIAAALANRLGGQTGFWSLTGIGSVFWVDLPAGARVPTQVVAPSERRALLQDLGLHPNAVLSLANLSEGDAAWVLAELSSCPARSQLVVRDAPAGLIQRFEGFFDFQNNQ